MSPSAGRQKLLVANWKMHLGRSQALEYLGVFKERVRALNTVEVALAPPFTLLETVGRAVQDTKIKLAAQNLFYARAGAFTGEISALMLKDLGCTYVIVGHSERRRLLGETDEIVHKKLRAAFEAELIPILCVGESLEEHRAGQTQAVLEIQLRDEGLASASGAKLVIAYEPVWAIGTGVNAEPEEAEASAQFLRKLIEKLYSARLAQTVRILYGGSVKPANFEGFLQQPNVDGALVGGASLDPLTFAQLAEQAERWS